MAAQGFHFTKGIADGIPVALGAVIGKEITQSEIGAFAGAIGVSRITTCTKK